jgi:hypothetical protein
MKEPKGILSGYKTYIIGALAIVTAIANYLIGDVELSQALSAAYNGLIGAGLLTLRAGVSK